MRHRIFYKVELAAWVYGTVDKLGQGISWQSAWVETYREIGGKSKTSGKKVPDYVRRSSCTVIPAVYVAGSA